MTKSLFRLFSMKKLRLGFHSLPCFQSFPAAWRTKWKRHQGWFGRFWSQQGVLLFSFLEGLKTEASDCSFRQVESWNFEYLFSSFCYLEIVGSLLCDLDIHKMIRQNWNNTVMVYTVGLYGDNISLSVFGFQMLRRSESSEWTIWISLFGWFWSTRHWIEGD